jgi:hypothetical protein
VRETTRLQACTAVSTASRPLPDRLPVRAVRGAGARPYDLGPAVPGNVRIRQAWLSPTIASAIPTLVLLGVAVALAWTLSWIGDQQIVYDAGQYLRLGQTLASGRFDEWQIRTYGYPAFLVPWILLAGNDLRALQWLVFAAQLAVHLAAAWLFARRVARAFGDDRLGRLTLVLVALNPFLLILAGVLLADLLSASLIAVGVALLLPARTDRPTDVVRDGMLALAALALATEVRPGNAILLPIGALLWTARWWTAVRVEPRRFLGGLLLVGAVAALPLIPQMMLNWRTAGQANPLLANDLYERHLGGGYRNLKYQTYYLRGFNSSPRLVYRNPLAVGYADVNGFAREKPLALAATYALHIFGLLDQDFAFPYVRELDPWYRWPLSTLNYLFIWAAAVGLVVGSRRWWRQGTRLAWVVFPTTAACYLLVYLPTTIESRYGIPVFILLAPVAAATLLAVAAHVRARAWRSVAVAGAGALLVVLACAWLSIWFQAQAPTLVMLRDFFRSPGPERPVATIETAPPDRWTVEQRQTYVVRASNQGERTWYSTQPVQVYLHVMFVGPGDAETVDSRVELRLPIERDVPPGDQVEMEVSVAAPRKEGSYRLRQQLELNKDLGLSGGAFHDTPVEVEVRRSRGGNRER